MAEPRPTVRVLSTGGTITMLEADGGGVSPALDADSLLASVPGLAEVARLETATVATVPGASLTLPQILATVGQAREAVDGGADGVVVIQGTDTLEETSFLAELVWDRAAPLVFTGAMRHPAQPGADGPANLLDSVRAAGSRALRGLGVTVCLGGDLHAARRVRKTHSSSPAAFTSAPPGPLGSVVEGRVQVTWRPERPPRLAVPADATLPAVALHRVSVGDDGRALGWLAGAGYAGVVLEAFGGGHVPSWYVEPLTALVAQLPVVLVSRTGGGEVLRETYGFPGSERDLLERGLLWGGSLDGLKARLVLTAALAAGVGRDHLPALLEACAG